jgi:hypothetical protein
MDNISLKGFKLYTILLMVLVAGVIIGWALSHLKHTPDELKTYSSGPTEKSNDAFTVACQIINSFRIKNWSKNFNSEYNQVINQITDLNGITDVQKISLINEINHIYLDRLLLTTQELIQFESHVSEVEFIKKDIREALTFPNENTLNIKSSHANANIERYFKLKFLFEEAEKNYNNCVREFMNCQIEGDCEYASSICDDAKIYFAKNINKSNFNSTVFESRIKRMQEILKTFPSI